MRFRFQYLVLAVLLVTTLAAWHSISTLSRQPFGQGQRRDVRQEGTQRGSYGNSPNASNIAHANVRIDKGGLAEKLLVLQGGNEEILPRKENSLHAFQVPGAVDVEDDSQEPSTKAELRHPNGQSKEQTEEQEETEEVAESDMPAFDISSIKSQSKTVLTDNVQHDRWIVLTTVNLPTDDVKFLANLTGWKVVVVGDTKTPADWSYPNCVFLSISRQESLGLSVPTKLPYRHYTRKNVGYLYAIAHGATVIYETDDDNRPLDRLQSFELESSTSGLMFAGIHRFNPYRHFGQPTLWPRGFPLSKIGAETTSVYRFHDRWPTPLIQQGVVNGDPDMDAVFRLTRKITLKPLDVHFDPTAPPVFLPAGVFSPFNSQNTLFLKQAFWALLIPTTTTFRICDIWRGYWAQRLLWEIDGHLGFYPPNAYQQRNAHSYMADMENEKDMYFETDRLWTFLRRWECPTSLTFFQCVYKLSKDMASERFWKMGDAVITKLWLEDLIRVGYKEPKRRNIEWKYNLLFVSENRKNDSKLEQPSNVDDDHNPAQSGLEKRRKVSLYQGSFVTFTAATQPPPEISTDAKYDTSTVIRHAESVAKLCSGLPVVSAPTKHINKAPGGRFDDILLVIVFNWPFYGNIAYTEVMYRHIFPNILYCGFNASLFMRDTSFLGKNLSFVEVPGINGGHFSHLCAAKAMQLKYNVKGYLFTADDVLLNPWNFARFDKNKIWMFGERYIFNTSANTGWMWWPTNMGSPAYHSSMEALRKIIPSERNTNGREGASKLAQRGGFTLSKGILQPKEYLTQLERNTGNASYAVHAISDVFYVPRRLSSSAVAYLNHFLEHHVFVELSVALTLFGLDNVANFETFKGVNLWMEMRDNPWQHFTFDNHFLHPVKLSKAENIAPLCTTYLPLLLAKGHA